MLPREPSTRKRKKTSQSVISVLKIQKKSNGEIKHIEKALLSYQNNETKTKRDKATRVSDALKCLERNRESRILQIELKRLECKQIASQEAIRRANSEMILSSQCQSEYAMLYSKTQNGSLGSDPYVVLNRAHVCEACGEENTMETEDNSSERVCHVCGYAVPVIEYTLGNLSVTEPREFYSGSYKRLNHLLDYLQHLQAKEEAPVPENLLTDVKMHLQKIKRNNSNKTLKASFEKVPKRYILDQISQCIKGSKYPKRFGSRVVQIMKKALGVNIPHLLHGEMREIKMKFRYLSDLYFKFAPIERRNFLSYPFAAWILIDLVSPNHPLLDYIQLLKNLPKLRSQENTVRRIFKHLGWIFRDIPWKHIRATRLFFRQDKPNDQTSANDASNLTLIREEDEKDNSPQDLGVALRVRLGGIKRV